MSDPRVDLAFRDRRLTRDRALVMAVIDGPATSEVPPREAIRQAVDEGADLVDIGGPDSPMSGAVLVSTIEWARTTYPELVISVHADHPATAEQVHIAGADVLDDAWSRAEPGVLEVAARNGLGYICAAESGRADRAATAGVPRGRILVRVAADPVALRQFGELVDGGWQVLVDVADTAAGDEDRIPEVLAPTALAARAGAVVFRSRHVRATRHAVEMVASILGTRPQSRPERWLA
jgi:dihydropteroate synthase